MEHVLEFPVEVHGVEPVAVVLKVRMCAAGHWLEFYRMMEFGPTSNAWEIKDIHDYLGCLRREWQEEDGEDA